MIRGLAGDRGRVSVRQGLVIGWIGGLDDVGGGRLIAWRRSRGDGVGLEMDGLMWLGGKFGSWEVGEDEVGWWYRLKVGGGTD
jgi:hypothetical protein